MKTKYFKINILNKSVEKYIFEKKRKVNYTGEQYFGKKNIVK